MSTYHSTFTSRKGTGSTTLAPYCVLTGLLSLLIVQGAFLFAPRVWAFQRAAQPENLARIGVSVVRIVANYTLPAALPNSPTKSSNSTENGSSFSCNGLGVIIASWTDAKDVQNAFILTDGSLVNKDAFTCGSVSLPGSISNNLTPLPTTPSVPSSKLARLSSINVYLSSAYSTSQIEITMSDMAVVQCNANPCSSGVSLFSFHNNTSLPLAILSGVAASSQPDAAGIQLSRSSAQLGTPSSTSMPQQYLTPTIIASNSTSNFEGGTPIVDQHGYLNKIYIKNGSASKFVPASEIQTLLNNMKLTPGAHPNAVNTAWQNGMTAFVQGKSSASTDFNTAFNDSDGQFQGAKTFAALPSGSGGENTTSSGTSRTPSGTYSTPSSNGIKLPFIDLVISYSLLGIIVACLFALVILVVVFTLIFRRGQKNTALVERNKMMTRDIRQAQEASQIPARASNQEPSRASASIPSGQPQVPVRASTPQEQAQANSIYSMSPAANATANISQFSPVIMNQSRASADYPTLDLQNSEQNASSSVESERTQPYLQRSANQPSSNSDGDMAYDVITNTNPGIKRKYKPNEDSLFAILGMRDEQGKLQKIGLFVVADGMGGHANGQDASRLAIQTIIDYILPRLAHNEATQENAEKLLVDGVQLANQAVHQHNVENNADMGTTVTATLVIGNTAHVANVGDSRTYLYRSSEGLKKVTRDHSVVASLVDAGIIKEDDIYTHPKRNQIYRSLGEKPFVEVDPFTVQLQVGDKILMCSDGLWDMVRDPLIKQVLERPVSETKQIGSNLINAALDGGGEDNVSVIVVNVVNNTPQPPKAGLDIIYLQDNVQMPSL